MDETIEGTLPGHHINVRYYVSVYASAIAQLQVAKALGEKGAPMARAIEETVAEWDGELCPRRRGPFPRRDFELALEVATQLAASAFVLPGQSSLRAETLQRAATLSSAAFEAAVSVEEMD